MINTDCPLSLRGLFVALSPYQIRDFRRWTEQVDFRCDILSKVPLEIAYSILEYLPLHQCFRIRRVCKGWFRMLSAEQTVRFLLRFWYPKHEACSQLAVPDGVSPSAASSSIAEHVDAYRTGSAFSMLKGFWRIASQESIGAHVAYANGILAWIDHRNDEIRIRHIISGLRERWVLEDGENLSHISMSASVLAAVTNAGICYVFNMADDQVQRFPLTSTSVQGLTVSGDSVAILYDRSPSESMHVEMSIWTPGRQNSVQCRVKLHGLPSGETSRHDRKIMIGTRKDCLVMFERCVELRRFYFTRFGLDGQLQAQGSLEGFDETRFTRHSESSVPSDINGCAIVWSYIQDHTEAKESSSYDELVQIQYDPQRDELRLKRNVYRRTWWARTFSSLFFWKDVAYCRSAVLSEFSVMIFDLTEDSIKDAVTLGTSSDSFFSNPHGLRRTRSLDERYIMQTQFLGDEDFLINIDTSGFVIWCFNGNVKMAHEDKDYAEHRQKDIQGRLEGRRELEAKRIAQVLKEEEIHLSIIGSVGSYHNLQKTEI